MEVLIVPGIILAFVVFYLLITYNNLVSLNARVEEAWSQIDVQLKRRLDLIPNLVSTVKAYAKHEDQVFEKVSKAREALAGASSKNEKALADNMLSQALKSVFAIAEAYPQLRATENFQQLQQELTDTEDKVAYSRQFYNNTVLDYNTSLLVFPNVLFIKYFGFVQKEFYGKDLSFDREPVKVDFSK